MQPHLGDAFWVAEDGVSILYEADRLCNGAAAFLKEARELLFQSSTRQTDFATSGGVGQHRERGRRFNPLRGRQTLQPGKPLLRKWGYRVSILYEADRLCNRVLARHPGQVVQVSILYEADRLCNRTCGFSGFSRFTTFQSSTRQTDFATQPLTAWGRSKRTFQSSTRQTDFATR